MNKTIGAWINNILITIGLPIVLGMVSMVIYAYLIIWYAILHSGFVTVMWVLTNPLEALAWVAGIVVGLIVILAIGAMCTPAPWEY